MAKSSVLCFLFFLLVISSSGGARIVAEAKDCGATWDCTTEERCWDDCRSRYDGKGHCDYRTHPFAPRQCNCSYKC
ncbi:unnamed protein product [Linum tenue]|uniref:Uncharacterized protein n=1 Tax=Linum tenue TaxID=586396 RepID=A0AAV0MQS0_9ROSI|nr:unnamed protein product [Linum tenue]